MARIRKIEISNFRGIQKMVWCPSSGINCLIGMGDSGKSTVLDAIDLCLGARRNVQISDADFYDLDITSPISITLTLGVLDDSMIALESFGPFLRSYYSATGIIEDEPSAGAEVVLCLNLTVTGDLEPSWTLISDRASQQGLVKTLAWKDRLAMTNVGVAELTRRLNSLNRGTARNPPSAVEMCALAFQRTPSMALAATLLTELRTMPNVHVHRPAILYNVLKALRWASTGIVTLTEASIRVREENRLLGRRLPKRAVGSTLLLKGLEAEVAVVLNAEGMSPQHLYVAMLHLLFAANSSFMIIIKTLLKPG